jgi:signal transduction histidine kinase
VPETLVYLVDEDPLAARDLATRLEQEGDLEIATFSSARAVRAAAMARRPDAVIAGLKLGARDGLDLIDELREADSDVVAMIMTSDSDAEATGRALAAVGPLGHVFKRCDMADLLPKLEAGLERRRLALSLRATRAALETRSRQVERTTAELESTHSELATATERLVQAEQLAAVGRVVTGIAHELERQLALVGYAEAIKSRVADDPELVEFADIIVNAQKRLSAMVDEIRDFVAGEPSAVPGAIDREPADLAAVVDEAVALMRYERDVRERTIARSYKARPLAALHRQKFSQVIMNLVSNAVLATDPGEVITIEITVEEDQAGERAVIAVTDRGVGMPAEVLARLGKPFFTTRGDRGSGLGVGICKRIVEDHGGQLTFESEVGAGTTARVWLPLLPESNGDPR